MAEGKKTPAGVDNPLPSTGSYKPVGATPSGVKPVGSTGSYMPVTKQGQASPSANSSEASTGSYKPVGQTRASTTRISRPVGPLPVQVSAEPKSSTASYKPVSKTPAPVIVSKQPGSIMPAGKADTGQNSMKSSSTGAFKPITTTPPRSSVKPPSGIRPRANPSGILTAQLQVGSNKAASSSTRLGNQWKCSSCNVSLGPQSVVQGLGIILDGKLICVDCVKHGKKRAAMKGPSTKLIFGTIGALLAMTGGVAFYVPGQVLVALLAIGVIVLIIGLLGFTMGGTARLSVIATGLAMIVFSVWGINQVQKRAEAKASSAAAKSESEEVTSHLSSNHVMEAKRTIGTIQERALVAGGGTIAPPEQKRVDALNALLTDWTKKNYGELSKQEHSALFRLFGEFGSVIANSARKFRAIKMNGNSMFLTMAVDPADVEPRNEVEDPRAPRARSGPQLTGSIALDKAAAVALFLVRSGKDVDSLELKLVTSSPGEDAKEYRTINLDNDAVTKLKSGDPSGLQKALDAVEAPQK